MATASQRVVERIPGKDDEFGAGGKYAYIELEARNVDEFEKLRAEAEKSPAFRRYDFDGTMGRKVDAAAEKAAPKATPKLTAAQKAKLTGEDVEAAAAEPEVGSADAEKAPTGEAESSAPVTPSAPASTPTEGETLSPRDRARQKLLERKKGA